jgi:hypothetical protein
VFNRGVLRTPEWKPGAENAGQTHPRNCWKDLANRIEVIMIGLLVDNDPYNITIAWSFGKEMKYV